MEMIGIDLSNGKDQSILRYKNYMGSVEYSEEDKLYWGKLLNTGNPGDIVLYDGETIEKLRQGFIDAVEDYIDTCKRFNKPLKS